MLQLYSACEFHEIATAGGPPVAAGAPFNGFAFPIEFVLVFVLAAIFAPR